VAHGNCRLLILDEPTIGIDVGAERDIRADQAFVRNGDKSVIFISSDMDEIQEISSRILVMSRQDRRDLDPANTQSGR